MLFSNDRSQLRRMYFEVWQKYQAKLPLEPLEQQILVIILEHPEYHTILNEPDKYLEKDFTVEAGNLNPFLHMSLHMAIREQIQTNRPIGITQLYEALIKKNSHEALDTEHQMMECLIESIWIAQRNNTMPNEELYLEQLRALL